MAKIKKKTADIIYYISVAVVTLIFLMFSIVMLNRWYAYVLIAVVCAAMVLLRVFNILVNWKIAVAWVAALALFVVSGLCCRTDMRVSVVADVYRSFQRFGNFTYRDIHGHTPTYDALSETTPQYDFDSWKAPKNYTNTEIKLTNSRGYFLKENNADNKYVIYQIHGGGYIAKFRSFYNDIALKYINAVGHADAFSLDYRTAPENIYPCALDDAVEGYMYLLDCGYAPEHIILTGDSAGGGIALSMALKIRDSGVKMPGLIVLSSPSGDHTRSGETYRTNAEKDVLFGGWDVEKVEIPFIPESYVGDNDPTNPYISPMYGTFENFPPCFITAGSDEMCLSDSLGIAEKIEAAGVKCELHISHGMYHTYNILTPFTREAKQAWAKIAEFVSENLPD